MRAVGSPNNEGTPWFGHPGRTPLADVDIKGNLFAGITDDAIMTVFRFSGEPGTGEVEGCFQYEQPTGKFTGPAFSPDARSLVWGEGDGIWRGEMPDLSGGCVAPPSGRLIIPGASNPDWSPAGVPTVPGPPPPPAPPAPPAPPVPVPPGAKPMTLSVAKQSLKTALKKGLTVQLANTTAKTKVTATLQEEDGRLGLRHEHRQADVHAQGRA